MQDERVLRNETAKMEKGKYILEWQEKAMQCFSGAIKEVFVKKKGRKPREMFLCLNMREASTSGDRH